ncbi:hypothetical protein [Sphingomonas sp.]|uniref:hypothetical protein n=1 Tax=Sphingomonas sp. TaxID=28214 RepID=UPI002E102EE2|nr:hypothetical protein [Sphingomonas sp.]
MKPRNAPVVLVIAAALVCASNANSHKLREKGVKVAVAGSALSVTPTRDWNRLTEKPGKNAETWTLDGGRLNDITFYGAVPSGSPLVKERSKKKEPLPKFTGKTLLVEVPELLEGTYRAYKGIGLFRVVSTEPVTFLGQDGVRFTYEFTDTDGLTRKGEATAVIAKGALYMITFDAPRLHYFDRSISDFRALVQSATIG